MVPGGTAPADDDAPRAPPEIAERLRARADPDGFVPFDRFMDVALYSDGVGLYARERSPLGPEGDFYTAAQFHPLFARTIAARLRELLSPRLEAGPARLVEIGPGDGSLAAGVIEALASLPGRDRFEYVLLERAAPLRRRALERAGPAGEAAGIRVRAGTSIGAEGPFVGVVLANELFDALPVRRLRWTGAEWKELGVTVTDGPLRAAEAARTDPVPPPPLPADLPPGTVVEVSSAGEALVREVADHLVDGELLVLDYGLGERELTAGHPRGGLRAVRRHRAVDDPLSSPGETDLSVFVNFDRLRSAARSAGLVELSFRSQAEALGAWGFPDLLAEALRAAPTSEAEVRLRLAAKNLLFGFERFCALELAPRSSVRDRAPTRPAAGRL